MKRIFQVLVLFLLPLALLSCSDQGEQLSQSEPPDNAADSKAQHGGIYRVPLQNKPASLDPAYAQDSYAIYVVHQLFEGLVKYDQHLMVVPALASSWRAEDGGRVYRFSLKPGAKFHNGSPVTSDDVVYSLKRLLRVTPPSVLQPYLLKVEGAQAFKDGETEHVQGLYAEGPETVVIRLIEPHTPFLTSLGMNQAKIVPQSVVEAKGHDFGRQPVGSGPFSFARWTAEEGVTLKRFDAYHDSPPYLESVHFKIYPGAAIERILDDFKAGQLEEMPVYGKIANELKGMPDVKLLHRPSLSLLYYGIRMDRPPLNHPDLRKALSLAIDRRVLVAEVYNGMFEPAWGIFPPGMPGYTPSQKEHAVSVEQARALVRGVEQELGEIPPLEVISASTSAFAKAELEFISRSWAEIGIRLHKKYISDWNEFEAYLHSDELQLFRYVWVADMPDPDNFMTPLFESNAPANFMHCSDTALDALLAEARSVPDPVERDALYERIESKVVQLQPVIPLFNLSTDRAFQPSVRGVFLTPLGWQDVRLADVWLEKGVAKTH